jgi:hypothetical protein
MAEAFTYKLTTESELFSFDFSQVLSPTETISTASCSVLVMDGTDTNPNAILSGGATISGSKANQRVKDGISEVTYRLVMTITTSATNTYTAVGDIPVYDPSLV